MTLINKRLKNQIKKGEEIYMIMMACQDLKKFRRPKFLKTIFKNLSHPFLLILSDNIPRLTCLCLPLSVFICSTYIYHNLEVVSSKNTRQIDIGKNFVEDGHHGSPIDTSSLFIYLLCCPISTKHFRWGF